MQLENKVAIITGAARGLGRAYAEVLANEPPMDPHDPGHMCHGGPFASVPLGEGATASMNIVDDKKEN